MMASKSRLKETVLSGNITELLLVLKQSSFCQEDLDEALHQAAWTGSLPAVKLLVSAGGQLHSITALRAPLMVGAVHSGNAHLVEYLLQQGYVVDFGVGDSGTTGVMCPLHLAVTRGDARCVETLLTAGSSLEYRDIDSDTCLIVAARSDQLTIVQTLLSHGCLVNARGYEGNTALHRAVEGGCDDIVSALIAASSCDVNTANQEGNTALFVACSLPNLMAAQCILRSGNVDPQHKNTLQETAFHMASKSGAVELMSLLLQLGVDYSSPDVDGNTPLITCARSGHQDFALKLLSLDSHTSQTLRQRGEGGRCALHWATCHGLEQLVCALLNSEPSSADETEDNGDTPFILAARQQQYQLLELFGKAKSDANIVGERGRTVLHWLSINGATQALDTILDVCRPHIDEVDVNLNTPLLHAVKNKHYLVARKLLSYKADVNAVDEDGRSCLHLVCMYSSASMVQELLQHGAETEARDAFGDCPLLLAAKNKQGVGIAELLAAEPDPNRTDRAGQTALHYCVSLGLVGPARLLLRYGADVNLRDANSCTPLLLAVQHGYEDLVLLLVDSGSDVNTTDKEHRLPVFFAAQKGMLQGTQKLLSRGSRLQNDCYSCPLIQAAKHGHTEILSTLISDGADVAFRDLLKRSALLWASQAGHLDIVNILLNLGCDPKLRDVEGDTPLILAAWHGHSHIVLQLAALSDIDHTENEEGMSALHLAVCGNHPDTVKQLLAAGSSVNVVDKRGNTALLTAVIHSREEDILCLLLDSKQDFDVSFQGEDGRSMCHWAVGDPASLQQVLQHKPDLDCLDSHGASPLLLAIAHNQPASAQLLVEAGCNVNVVHEDGRCPIHHAVLYNDLPTVQLLLSRGVDPNTATSDLRTPLLLAAMEGHCSIVQCLLQCPQCRINDVFFDAITALSVAAANRHYSVMYTLLQHGSDPDLIGNQKPRPLVACVYSGDVQGAVLLLQAGATIDQGHQGQTRGQTNQRHPLQVAAIKNDTFMLQLLATLDCDVNNLRSLLTDGTIYYFVDDDEILRVLEDIVKLPKSMQVLCRQVIRSHIGVPIARQVEKLPLPHKMKEYLEMKELNFLLTQDIDV